MPLDRPGNLLGALASAISDRTSDALAAESGASGASDSAAAALSALHHFLQAPSVDSLRRVLGLTSSGTVRLLDRLERSGHVRRGPGDDRRAVAVSLTPAGRRAARRLSAARGRVLEGALSPLTPTERKAFEALAAKMLVGLMREPGAVRWTCRLCDTTACGRDTGGCPVADAARARYPS